MERRMTAIKASLTKHGFLLANVKDLGSLKIWPDGWVFFTFNTMWTKPPFSVLNIPLINEASELWAEWRATGLVRFRVLKKKLKEAPRITCVKDPDGPGVSLWIYK